MPPNVPDHRPSLQGHRLWSGLSVLSKRSFRSFTTSSFEADDERSLSDDDDMSDSESRDQPARSVPAPLYLGQDSRPTSRKELLGWYAYAFAAETYIICGIGMFSSSVRLLTL
jgi:UMF1 family MFS transporter